MRLRHKLFAISALVVMIAFLVIARISRGVQTSLVTQTSRGALALPLQQAPLQGKEVFRKQLADKSVLLVLQTPGVYVKKPPTIPGAIVIHPDSIYVISLFLVSADRKTHRLLWKRNFLLYLKNPSRQKFFIQSPKYEFFDLSLEANRLVLLFHDRWRLYGKVVDLDAPVTALNSQSDRVIPTPTDVSVCISCIDVTTAHFEDPVVDGVPGIAATSPSGEERHYIWNGGAWIDTNPRPKKRMALNSDTLRKLIERWLK